MIITVSWSSVDIGRISVFQEVLCPKFKIRFRAHRCTYFDVAVFALN